MSSDLPDPLHGLPVDDDDLDPAIAAVLWRTYSEDVDVDTAARHLWRIDRAARPPAPSRPRAARRSLVAALSGLMIIMSAGGALAASNGTVPGDALYSVKRGAERTRLLLAFSPESDARLHLAMARQRLSEADVAAVRRPQVVPRLLEDAATAIEQAEATGSPAVAREAAVVRGEASEKAVALALVLDDEDGKAELVATGERLRPPTVVDDTAVATTTLPPDRVVTTTEPPPFEPTEPPVETALAETGPVETAPSTPVIQPSPSPSPRPRPSPSPSPSPDPEEEQEPEPEDGGGDGESDEELDGELPPADPKDAAGTGKDTQDLKSETSEAESGSSESEGSE